MSRLLAALVALAALAVPQAQAQDPAPRGRTNEFSMNLQVIGSDDYDFDGGATVPLWWVDVEEWDGLIDESGLELEARYGWFDWSPFDESSREAIYVARKPE
jgi:hypothetical protein